MKYKRNSLNLLGFINPLIIFNKNGFNRKHSTFMRKNTGQIPQGLQKQEFIGYNWKSANWPVYKWINEGSRQIECTVHCIDLLSNFHGFLLRFFFCGSAACGCFLSKLWFVINAWCKGRHSRYFSSGRN